ncbi:MAG: LacI family DNA-binding transcriptional regulator [Melioribacteraceae bacterium]|jgi:DNA-binding LacI/PurR family transcriptional regulator|nr:LacI family DNA-binding transcriptional regulator [Melioribacteraceae bacterium]
MNKTKEITIGDIAKRAGVSKGTVSAVLNEKMVVKRSTREKILLLMKELNYRPKGFARNLKNGDPGKCIGIIVKELNYPFYTTIAEAAKEYASSKGYSLVMASSDYNHETEKNIMNLFLAKDIRGAIIAPILEGNSEIAHLFKLKNLNYPFVLLADVKGIVTNVVEIDNSRAIGKAVEYLIKNGHKKIVHFAGPPESAHTRDRIEGFQNAFSESTLVFNKSMIVPIGAHAKVSYEKTVKYFSTRKRKDYPTAIVCFNDLQALAVMTALRDLDIKVPKDISVIGNDDINYAEIYSVPLTTIRSPQKEIGQKAAEILIRNIESSPPAPIERIILDTELVVRKSTRKINVK